MANEGGVVLRRPRVNNILIALLDNRHAVDRNLGGFLLGHFGLHRVSAGGTTPQHAYYAHIVRMWSIGQMHLFS